MDLVSHRPMKGLLAAFLALAIQAETPRQSGIIEGVVVSAANGQPIASAGVELTRLPDGKPVAVAATTPEGRFVFENIEPGDYRIAATHIGYLRSEYGQRGPNGTGLTITIAAAQTIRAARISLIETSSIYGHIYDRSGAPAPNVEVRVLKYTYKDGVRTLSTAKAVRTNDLGEYRLFWLPPDQYYISATALRGEVMDVTRGGGGRLPPAGYQITLPGDEGMAPSYYPGTADPELASPIKVGPGESVGGVDIRIAPVATHRIRGVLRVHPTTTDPAAKVPMFSSEVQLAPRESRDTFAGVDAFSSKVLRVGPDMKTGAFEIRGVLPGSYVASVSGSSGNPGVYDLNGRAVVQVRDADVDDVIIELFRDFDLPVKVSIQGQPADSLDLGQLLIRIEFNPPAKPQQPAGMFLFDDVGVGDYHVSVSRLPENGYVKSISIGAIDVVRDGLQLHRPPDRPMEIVIGSDGGILDGTAVDDKGEPLWNAKVVLIPDPARRNQSDLYKSASTDASGRFRMTAIPPGEYKAFAWEDIENGEWHNPDFIRVYENSGKPVQIEGKSQTTVRVTAVPARNSGP